jgi:hypothetical protein
MAKTQLGFFLDVSMTPCQFDNLFIDHLAFYVFFLLPLLSRPRSLLARSFSCSLFGFCFWDSIWPVVLDRVGDRIAKGHQGKVKASFGAV